LAIVTDKIIHFGEFVRWNRVNAGKTTEEFGREVSLTARRVIAIEAMAKPDVQHTTIVALAKAFNIDPEDFDRVWQSTPVPVTKRKKGPTTDEATRFATACAAAGVTTAEGLRHLRSWLVAQDEETQQAALGFIAPPRGPLMFNAAVDHLQDPAEAAQKRIAQQATKQAKSRGSASTTENKHR
jgi:transcriptional regulator with XRE-family HTH domain